VLTAEDGALYPTIWIYDAGGIRIRGFELTAPRSNGGIRIENSHDVEVAGCEIHHTGHGGVSVFGTGTDSPGARNIQLWGNRFHHNGGHWASDDPYWLVGDHSVYWGGVSDHEDGVDHTAYGGVIANNIFHDQPVGRALQIGSQASGLIVTNNTFYRAFQPNRRAGTAIEFYGEGTPYDTREVLVVNNIIARSANYGISGSGGSDVMRSNLVRNNLAWDNGAGDFNTTYGSASNVLYQLGPNITARAPRFVAPYKLDFRLQRRSPAIDRADRAYAPRFDRAGRPRNGRPDLGAHEWSPTTARR
jgi:Right handed beta helix region